MAKAKSKTGATKPKKKAKGAAKARPAKTNAFDALARLAEHPIVADLIAVGATAAVTAITTGMSSKSGKTSSRAVKDAGKAAATAIGQRLMTEIKAVKASAKEAKSKKS